MLLMLDANNHECGACMYFSCDGKWALNVNFVWSGCVRLSECLLITPNFVNQEQRIYDFFFLKKKHVLLCKFMQMKYYFSVNSQTPYCLKKTMKKSITPSIPRRVVSSYARSHRKIDQI